MIHSFVLSSITRPRRTSRSLALLLAMYTSNVKVCNTFPTAYSFWSAVKYLESASTVGFVHWRCHYHRTNQKHSAIFSSATPTSSSDSTEDYSKQPNNVAIIGGGLAGLSVAYHLLDLRQQGNPLHITIYDKSNVGQGGASAVAGG
jgi:NADPH-dependent 2,4-dienoyl-CoA reductase/sulfur reductase-like enzyme